jgi:hypothetical protein
MVPIANPIPEPEDFDVNCRQAGNLWLNENPNSSKFPGLWTEFNEELADGFHNRCGWWAMFIAEGHVDHYRSKKNQRNLVYEWSNYRYIAGTVNSSKRTLDDRVLDPFEIEEGWFEVHLQSMQLVMTDDLPDHLREKAKFTLERLHLENGKKVRRNRLGWYQRYKDGKISIAGLEEVAPLVADAVRKWEAENRSLP